jgi:hypothetical protein
MKWNARDFLFSARCCMPLQLPLIFNEPKALVHIGRYHYQYLCQKNNQI